MSLTAVKENNITGWLCPKCSGAHGPHVDSCPVNQAFPAQLGQPPFWNPTFGQQPPFQPYEVKCGGVNQSNFDGLAQKPITDKFNGAQVP